MTSKKKCNKCIYYLAHYIKDSIRFKEIPGHCINVKPNGRFRKTDEICECYEEKDMEKAREDDICAAIDYIKTVSYTLDDIRQILTAKQKNTQV